MNLSQEIMTKYVIFVLLLFGGKTSFAQEICAFTTNSIQKNPSDSAKRSVLESSKSNSLLKSAIIPLSLITAGVLVESLPSQTTFSKKQIQQHVQEKLKGFSTAADNYLQFAPMAAMFSFKLAGLKSRSDLLNQVIITAKTEFLVTTIVTSMKHVIHDWRPDGSAQNSMPSGHTAQAFASAALLDMEYRNTSPWISVGGYLCATATGFFRVANNRHWTSDVLIGAGIGIVSVKLVYFTHKYKWGNKQTTFLIPTIYQNGGGLTFTMKL